MDVHFVISFTWIEKQRFTEIADAVHKLAIGFGATECRVASTIQSDRDILCRAVEWWEREGQHKFDGAPEWVFAARQP